MISNVNSLSIVTSSICETRAIVTSHWSIILTLYLWMLSSSQWRCQPGRFSMVAHFHDGRGIYRCVLLLFRGRIEIDHLYGLRCRGLCCHSLHTTRGAGQRGHATAGPTCAVPGVAAQTTPAQTVLWSIPISQHCSKNWPCSRKWSAAALQQKMLMDLYIYIYIYSFNNNIMCVWFLWYFFDDIVIILQGWFVMCFREVCI